MAIQVEKIHHVAYSCKDAKETVEWYKKNLNAKKIRIKSGTKLFFITNLFPYGV